MRTRYEIGIVQTGPQRSYEFRNRVRVLVIHRHDGGPVSCIVPDAVGISDAEPRRGGDVSLEGELPEPDGDADIRIERVAITAPAA